MEAFALESPPRTIGRRTMLAPRPRKSRRSRKQSLRKAKQKPKSPIRRLRPSKLALSVYGFPQAARLILDETEPFTPARPESSRRTKTAIHTKAEQFPTTQKRR